MAEAIFTGPQGPPPRARLEQVCAQFDDILIQSSRQARLLLRFCLFLVSVIAPLFVLRVGPLRWLSLDKRIQALTRMEESFASAPIMAIKAVLCIVYYEHPDAAREVGFEGFGLPPLYDVTGAPRQEAR